MLITKNDICVAMMGHNCIKFYVTLQFIKKYLYFSFCPAIAIMSSFTQ